MADSLPTPESLFSDSDAEVTSILMSTAFFPCDDYPSNLVIISADGVFFSVHREALQSKSTNNFAGLLMDPKVVALMVEEGSTPINLVLNLVYGFDPYQYGPSLEDIGAMLLILLKYGIFAPEVIIPGNSFFVFICGLALMRPLDTYALVCQYNLERLAVEVSQHLLSLSLDALTNELCINMGPVYLRRLVFLHLGRIERLRILLKELPPKHTPTPLCDELDQKRLMHASWQTAASELTWEITPNMSVSLLRTTFNPVIEQLPCIDCQVSTRGHIRKLILDWSTVRNTI